MRFTLWILTFIIFSVILLLFNFYIISIFANMEKYRFFIQPLIFLIFSFSSIISTLIYYPQEIKNKKGIIEYLEEWDKKRIAADREKK